MFLSRKPVRLRLTQSDGGFVGKKSFLGHCSQPRDRMLHSIITIQKCIGDAAARKPRVAKIGTGHNLACHPPGWWKIVIMTTSLARDDNFHDDKFGLRQTAEGLGGRNVPGNKGFEGIGGRRGIDVSA